MKRVGRGTTLAVAMRSAGWEKESVGWEYAPPKPVIYPIPKTRMQLWSKAFRAFFSAVARPAILTRRVVQLAIALDVRVAEVRSKDLEIHRLRASNREYEKQSLADLNTKNRYLAAIEDYTRLAQENQSLRYELAYKGFENIEVQS
jgi:hypothetical protein